LDPSGKILPSAGKQNAIAGILHLAMKDYSLDLIIGEGSMARNVKIELAPFTVIGATYLEGKISKRLRTLFKIVHLSAAE
jgi:Holliday junction DNA helicase RuvB